jgi:hypothetical protein
MEAINLQIPIINNGRINPIFIKATSFLLLNFSNEVNSLSSDKEKNEKLKELWGRVYFANIIEDKNNWNSILFKNCQDKTMFLLKYTTM